MFNSNIRTIAAQEASTSEAFQHDDFTLSLLLVMLNALNLADFGFTVLSFSKGFQEGNPIMDALFSQQSLVTGGLVKIGIGLAVSLAIWTLRRHLIAVKATLFIIMVYLFLFLYHIYGFVRYIL